MTRRDLILGTHRDAIVATAAANKATEIALVGSVARGDDDAASDVDFLATFAPGADLFDIGGLLADLEELLGGQVDVIDASALKPDVREGHRAMLAEAIPL
ncbi:MAG: nucleotidyltransferase domain-containing protein [bacterium]|nr:nucleotidyltransferase domain-containing protein [bacterium]